MPQNILFFGDSLTAGYQLPASASFPSRIQEKIDALGLPYKAHNYGVSGETSAGGRQRLPTVLPRFPQLDVFVLELGANDGLRGIPVRETTQNLQFILDAVQHAHPQARRVLVGLEFPFDLGPLATLAGGRLGHYAQEFNALFRQLADKNEVDFVPFLLQGVIGQRHLNLPDGVHPNAEGQKLLADNVWQVLGKVLGA
ncbi:arylesterase [Hymenobacter aerophilus]|uniref:arylesterase n=1 Tax=Hymenobacter aerophilus TaxID=119644 RepID=UPI00035F077C|nr:arylesterase [Hymenobacter aerophilus]